jgi:hypothetical protein
MLASDSTSVSIERFLFHRRLLAWVHAALGFITALIYLSRINFARMGYWRPGFGVALIFIVALPMFPYLLSAMHSRKVVTADRMRVALFILVLMAGCILMGSLLAGAFGPVSRLILLVLFGVQTFMYMWAAEALLHVE